MKNRYLEKIAAFTRGTEEYKKYQQEMHAYLDKTDGMIYKPAPSGVDRVAWLNSHELTNPNYNELREKISNDPHRGDWPSEEYILHGRVDERAHEIRMERMREDWQQPRNYGDPNKKIFEHPQVVPKSKYIVSSPGHLGDVKTPGPIHT